MKKILVVEDEPSIAHLIAHNLERTGYGVEIAEDGEQACVRVEFFGSDLVTLDLLLPLKSGWQALEYIRRHFSGVHHCLSKPFSISELCLLVRQQLSPALRKSIPAGCQATG